MSQQFTYQSPRRTGRTTRMLEEAKRLDAEGKAVYIVVANQREVDRILDLLGPDYPSIKAETVSSLCNFHWEDMRLRGAHPNCVVLADHYAIESQFGMMLDMLHRFDEHEPG
jgi:hypothetical protein